MALAKTEVGQRAFKERSAQLTVRQRSAFILFDGVKSVAQIISSTTGLGVTLADVEHMVLVGFLAEKPGSGLPNEVSALPVALTQESAAPSAQAPSPTASIGARTPQERFAEAWPLATQLTAGMGLRGFRLNLSIEAARGYDDLLALFPKIQAAVGVDKALELEGALKG